MPMKRKGRKQVKRRFAKKRPTVNVNRALAPIPQRYITKMKFAADVSTDNAGYLRINLNSIWDPLRSGSASPDQPYGRDQLAILYNRYRVISCGWRLTAPNSGGVIQVAALPSNEVYNASLIADMRENPRCKYFMQHNTGEVELLTGKTYIPSLVGRSKAQYMADDRYQADVTANPSELAVLNVAVGTASGTLLTTGQIINVLLEYTVEFFDVKSLPIS